MKKIGLLSDTHGYMDDRIVHHLKECNEIWHAGDIGASDVLNTLEMVASVRSVFGNIDGQEIRKRCPEYISATVEGCKVLIIHIAGSMGNYNIKTKTLIDQFRPDLLVCGHSHILKVKMDPKGFLYMNPGAAGRSGFHQMRTMLRFDIYEGKPQNLELIELGPRAQHAK